MNTSDLFNHPDLVAAYRYPFDPATARKLAGVVAEYPNHRFDVAGSFLFILEVRA